MAGVAVVTDSTSSLGEAEVSRTGITVIALQVVVDGLSRPETAVEVTPAVVAAALRGGKRVSTSRPSPEVFAATYAELAGRGYAAIVSVHLSSAISATCDAARVAAEAAPVPVTVVDSGTIAMATGFAVISAAEAALRGAPAAEVAELARARAAAAVTYFYVDSLEYLRRGGRIGPGAALLGSALSVKPLLTVADGLVRPYERVRTTGRALARLADLAVAALARAAGTAEVVDAAVHHLDNAEAAEQLLGKLRGRLTTAGGDLILAEVSAVLGVHVGPGTVGVVISPRP